MNYKIDQFTYNNNTYKLIDNTTTIGTGLSKSVNSTGPVLNHSNSVTAKTTQALYPITFDTQGHITSAGNSITPLTSSSSIAANKITGLATINNNSLTGGGNITLNASDVGALPSNTTYVSSFNGSSGAITYTAPVTSVNGQTGAVTVSVPTASITTPSMNGTASYGTGTTYARADHVHPTDTSRQATLVSGTNIKTINGNSILGSGDLVISGGEGGSTAGTIVSIVRW